MLYNIETFECLNEHGLFTFFNLNRNYETFSQEVVLSKTSSYCSCLAGTICTDPSNDSENTAIKRIVKHVTNNVSWFAASCKSDLRSLWWLLADVSGQVGQRCASWKEKKEFWTAPLLRKPEISWHHVKKPGCGPPHSESIILRNVIGTLLKARRSGTWLGMRGVIDEY